jgi:hypothetical protein
MPLVHFDRAVGNHQRTAERFRYPTFRRSNQLRRNLRQPAP